MGGSEPTSELRERSSSCSFVTSAPVGLTDGELVGSVGVLEGTALGIILGTRVGRTLGLIVGDLAGTIDGTLLGSLDGMTVGRKLGEDDGYPGAIMPGRAPVSLLFERDRAVNDGEDTNDLGTVFDNLLLFNNSVCK